MAERLSVKEMMAAARKGGAAKPAGEPAEAEVQAEAPAVEAVEVEAAPAPVAVRPAAAPLDRPLTMKEKLAAARSGGAATPGAAPTPAAARVAAPVAEATTEIIAAAPAAPVPTAESLGRPLTMKEKLAAARGNAAPAPAAGVVAKPAAAKAAAPAAGVKAAARELPPLDKITDPRDLAEALRRAGADKDKVAKADAAARAATAAGATPASAIVAAKASAAKKLETKTIPPKPSKDGTAAATSAAPEPIGRRPFLWGMGIGAIIVTGWSAFLVGITGQTLACVRFMFPNVLAEPPSTIKVGPASNFEPEQVNDRWKAEWGFWIVRSAAYDGEDKIYAIQSVCTHLGCPPNWLAAETKFKCPCHGSGFYISGVNFEGPAPRPLERFKVTTDAGEIVVDKSQKFQEELKQWSDADSFIIA